MTSPKFEMQLVTPTEQHLPSYVEALQRGWSQDNVRGRAAAKAQLDLIANDPLIFLARCDDVKAKGPAVVLPDGSTAKRLPGINRWMWDGEFCGSLGLRWQPGTSQLPLHVLGHVGFSVVPWRQRRGHATRALGLILPIALEKGLDYIEVTTDLDNIPSQKVIEANGGLLHERFKKPTVYGGSEALRYRITL